MRIPVYDEPQVAPEQGPAPRESFSPLEPLGQGLQRAGTGLDQVGQQLRVAHEKAVAAVATDAEAQFETAADQAFNGSPDGSTPGLLSLKGQDAMKQSVPALQALEQRRQQLASGIKDADARDYYLRSTEQSMVHRKALAEHFVGEQVQAYQQQATQALVTNKLKAISSAPGDDAFAADQVASMSAATLAQLHGAPKEVQDQAISGIKAQVAQTRLQSLLAPKADGSAPDFQRAQAVLEQSRGELGADVAGQYQKQISASSDAFTFDQKSHAVLAGAKVPGTRWFDANKALADVDAMPEGNPREEQIKDETRKRVEHELEVNRRDKEQFGQDLLEKAKTVYAQTKNPNDPRLAPIQAQLLDDKNNLGGVWSDFQNKITADARSSRYADTAARQAQAELDKTFISQFGALSPKEMAQTDLGAFTHGHASDWGIGQMQKIKNKAVAELRNDGGLAIDTMLKGVAAASEQAHFDKPTAAAFRSTMTNWWLQQREANGGKVVDQQLVDKQLSSELQKVVVQGSGFLYGLGPNKTMSRIQAETGYPGKALVPVAGEAAPPAVQTSAPPQSAPAPAAPPTAKQVRAYRYTKDRAKRAPVYADGTLGALEAVNGR